jgi:hypothetical protein
VPEIAAFCPHCGAVVPQDVPNAFSGNISPEDQQRIYEEEKARLEAQAALNAETPRQTKPSIGIFAVKWAVLVVAIVVLIFVVLYDKDKDKPRSPGHSWNRSSPGTSPSSRDSGSSASYSAPSPSSGRLLRIGEEGHLVRLDPEQKWLPLGTTKGAFDELVSAKAANDRHGIGELLVSGRVFTVPSGTRILCLDLGFTKSKVRILDGEHAGAAGWTYTEHLRQ